MARRARVVIPGLPHHVTHSGNLRAQVFFCDSDREFYLRRHGLCARRFNVDVWAHCLMTNHIHLIAVPRAEESLSRALGQAHKRYFGRGQRAARVDGESLGQPLSFFGYG